MRSGSLVTNTREYWFCKWGNLLCNSSDSVYEPERKTTNAYMVIEHIAGGFGRMLSLAHSVYQLDKGKKQALVVFHMGGIGPIHRASMG